MRTTPMRPLALLALVVVVLVSPAAPRAAEVTIKITVAKDKVVVDPLTGKVEAGDTIKWVTGPAGGLGEAKHVQIVLTSPDPVFEGGDLFAPIVALGEAVPSPRVLASAATTRMNTHGYEVRILKEDGRTAIDALETLNFLWVPGPRDGKRVVRGLFIRGGTLSDTDKHLEDVPHLRDVIGDSTAPGIGKNYGVNWERRRERAEFGGHEIEIPGIVVRFTFTGAPKDEMTEEVYERDIEKAFKEADDDDVSVYLFAGHGSKEPGGTDEPVNDAKREQGSTKPEADVICSEVPEAQCNEQILVRGKTLGREAERFIDDQFGPESSLGLALRRVRGLKVIVIEACRSGGMMDGKRDLPLPNSIVMTSCGTNELSWRSLGAFRWDFHSWFVGSLINGFLANDEGFAQADLEGLKGEVTVGEWFRFAEREVKRLMGLAVKATEKDMKTAIQKVKNQLPGDQDPTQTPAIRDDYAPAGSKRDDVVIFKYEKGMLAPHHHTPLREDFWTDSGCASCEKSDCPICGPADCPPALVFASAINGHAKQVGLPDDGAEVKIQGGKFSFDGVIDLSAATVTVTHVLNEATDAGELVSRVPFTLSPRRGGKPRAAIFESGSGSRPDRRMEIKTRDGKLYEFAYKEKRGSIRQAPGPCVAGEPTARLLTRFTIDDGLNPPLTVLAVEDWRCSRTQLRVSRSAPPAP